MRIVSFNANGIRSAARKNFFDWLPRSKAHVVCVQETRAQVHQVEGDATFFPDGWHVHYKDAEKKGYSGVAVYSRVRPDQIITEFGDEVIDGEGRYIEARFGKLSVVSLYLPPGTSGDERQTVKYGVMDRLLPRLRAWLDSPRDYILCGDWNIAHKPVDLKNWRSNQKNSGFLPEERAWLDAVFGDVGWVDGYRHRHPQHEGEAYTWWSNRGQARAKNVGWRIDYQVITPALAPAIREASVYKEEFFSDHAPLILDYALDLPGSGT
jgi:exodeoxyribonuclease III